MQDDNLTNEGDQEQIRQAVQRAAENIAITLLEVNFPKARKGIPYFPDQQDLSPEQGKALGRTTLYRQLTELAEHAWRTERSIGQVRSILVAACRFYKASGMSYRQMEWAQFSSKQGDKKNASLIRNADALGGLNLWLTPNITSEAGMFGRDSMNYTDRDKLRAAVNDYFETGLRCSWFEKMLLEALVAAETWATNEEIKKNPVLTGGQSALWRTVLWTWAYDKSHGRSPMYAIYLGTVTVLTRLVGLVALLALTWSSVAALDGDHALWGYLGILVCGWIALNWVGRFATRLIVGWATPPMQFKLGDVGIVRATAEMGAACRIVLAPAMSLHLVRESLIRCGTSLVAFDQIAHGLIDRAIAGGETMWFSKYSPTQNLYEDEDMHSTLFPEDEDWESLPNGS